MPGRTISAGAVLASASAAQAAVSFLTFGLPSIGPDLRRHFGLTLTELGAVLSANLFGAGLALLAAGVAVDRFGARRATLAGCGLAAGGLVAAALAGSKAVLFATLVLAGMGSAVVPVAGAGALFSAYPAARRGWALGVRQMAVPLGGTIGAATVPALRSLGGAELVLLVGAGALAVTGTAFGLVGDDSPSQAPRSGAGRAFRTIWRAPGIQRLLVVACFYIVALQAVLVYTVPAARAAGLSAFAASATYFAVNVSAMAARLSWGRIADRNGGARRTRTLVETGLVSAAGAVLFTFALHAGAGVVVAAAAVFGFGALGWNALVYVSAGERAAPELAARSVALAATVVFLVAALSTPFLGALADHAGWDVFWSVTACVAAVGAALASTLPRSLPATT